MSSNKRPREEEGDESVSNSEEDVDNGASDEETKNDGANKGEGEGNGEKKADPGPSSSSPDASNDAKKPKISPDEKAGTVLFCGATDWDTIGKKTKTVRGGPDTNLWGPHRLSALAGIKIKKVVSGNNACHSIIVTEDGKAMSWGRNDKGQLGLGDLKRRDNPTYIDALKDHRCVDAACGKAHSLVLTEQGIVFGFGDNKMGQCGIGTNTQEITTPTKVQHKGRPIIKLSCGREYSMVLDLKGGLYSFGCPEYGQLGHNTDGKYFVTSTKMGYSCEQTPRIINRFIEKNRQGHTVPVDDVTITQVSCGANHTVCMDSKGRCYTWGFGGYGRLGHAEPKDEMIPRLVKVFDGGNGRRVKQVFAGTTYTLAISDFGALYFWGQNKVGGEATMYPKPMHDLSGYNIRDVGTSNHSIVVATDDGVISWGCSPTFGELGYGEHKTKSSTVPQECKPMDGFELYGVTCGHAHTLFIVRDSKEEDKTRLEAMPEYAPK